MPQKSQALLQSILDTMPDGLVVIDRAGIVQSFNTAAERMFGYTQDEIVGRNVAILMPPPQAAAHDNYIARYLQTRERHVIGIGRVVSGQRKDGSTFPAELQVAEVKVADAHFFTGVLRDLTERQDRDRRLAELQSELIHVSRLSELGQMVSALAHEVNQPLTAVANYLSGIRRLLPEDSPPMLRTALEKVAEQADRARGIVQSLRDLVRKQAKPGSVQDLDILIQETSALVLIGTSRSVSLRVCIAPNAHHIVADRVQIQQILLNLMRNAVEAMASSPTRTLTIRARSTGTHIAISVADTGPGLPEEVRAQMFRPFVTTKPDGLGVGLSICRTIVEAHNGTLSVESEPGKGTTFTFTIPAPQAAPPAPSDLDQ